jgi:RES domain
MRKIRNPELLDGLQELKPESFKGQIWRMARTGRDPLLATSPKGRWDDGSFEVLYTACSADAARAEMHFHLTRSQPVFPSSLQLHLHELECDLSQVYVFDSVEALGPFGVNVSDYGRLSYAKLQEEYTITQQIGEAVHFLGGEGLIVPSARWPEQNLVVITGHAKLRHIKDHGTQDLRTWGQLNNH